jgi:hypothetical protein
MPDKKDVPSFDELKDSRFDYHYSREERMAGRRKEEKPPVKKKGLERFLGGNKQVKNFLFFYLFIAVIAWLYLYLHNPGSGETRKVFQLKNSRSVAASMINSNKHGINVLLSNNGNSVWQINSLKLYFRDKSFETNVQVRLNSGEFEVFFFETEGQKLNMNQLKVAVNQDGAE